MLYSPQKQFVFVHIWKTAGSSVTRTLRPFCPPYFSNPFFDKAIRVAPRAAETILGWRARLVTGWHLTASSIRDVMPPAEYDRCFKFVFVRNPWDWQVSNYHYALQSPTHGQHELVKALGTFESYIRYQHANNAPSQSSFIFDTDGKSLVDFVGRFETLNRDFETICKRIGVDAQLKHLKRSVRDPRWRNYYTDETQSLVADLFDCDFKNFGYDWDRSYYG